MGLTNEAQWCQHDIRHIFDGQKTIPESTPSSHLTRKTHATRAPSLSCSTEVPCSQFFEILSLTPTPTIFPWVAAEALLTSTKTTSQREMSLAQSKSKFQSKCERKSQFRRHLHLPWIPLQVIRRDALEHIPNIKGAVVQRDQIHVAGRYLRPSK